MRVFHDKRVIRDVRRALRTQGTAAEAMLWMKLKNKQLLGRKFRRQHSAGPFVLDFYCPSERLAIEVDGSVHDHPVVSINDAARDEFLLRSAIRVLRFENKEVSDKIEGVLEQIAKAFRSGAEQEGTLPRPLPK